MIQISISGYEPVIDSMSGVETYVRQLSQTQRIVITMPGTQNEDAVANIRQAIAKSVKRFSDYGTEITIAPEGIAVKFTNPVPAECVGVILVRLYNLIDWASRREVKLKSSKLFSVTNFNALTTEQRFIK